MTAGVLFALTLPGLVVLLVLIALVEHVVSRQGRRSPVHRQRRAALSASGMDVFSAALSPGRATALDQHRLEEMLRDDEEDGAPRRPGCVDLERRIVYLSRPAGADEPEGTRLRSEAPLRQASASPPRRRRGVATGRPAPTAAADRPRRSRERTAGPRP
jgi:hypothetical protein